MSLYIRGHGRGQNRGQYQINNNEEAEHDNQGTNTVLVPGTMND